MKKPAATGGQPAAGKQAAAGAKDKKKMTPAELAKLEEELKARRDKRLEEEKKYGIYPCVEGLPLLLTQDCLEKTWSHPNPKEYLRNFLQHQFDRLGTGMKVKPEEKKMFVTQLLADLIYLKSSLECPSEKLTILCNLLFRNMINNDQRFTGEVPFVKEKPADPAADPDEEPDDHPAVNLTDHIELEDGEDLDDIRARTDVATFIGSKSYETDVTNFKVLLGRVAKKYPVMFSDKQELAHIVQHGMTSYFSRYSLFRCVSLFTQTEEPLQQTVSIDEPTAVQPLAQATMVAREAEGTLPTLQKDTQEDFFINKEVDETRRKEREEKEERDRVLREEWLGLDERTVKIIQDRLEKTREQMIKKIETKKEEYLEKVAASKAPPKKK